MHGIGLFPCCADPYLAPADPSSCLTPVGIQAPPVIMSFDSLEAATVTPSSSLDTRPSLWTASEPGPSDPSTGSNKRNHDENDDRALKKQRV
jgi:hypothetical protein